jgi:hypothetical protein
MKPVQAAFLITTVFFINAAVSIEEVNVYILLMVISGIGFVLEGYKD